MALGDKLLQNREKSQNHRMAESFKQGPPRLLRSLYSQVLKTSRDGDCTTFLCNLFQCSTVLKMRDRRK